MPEESEKIEEISSVAGAFNIALNPYEHPLEVELRDIQQQPVDVFDTTLIQDRGDLLPSNFNIQENQDLTEITSFVSGENFEESRKIIDSIDIDISVRTNNTNQLFEQLLADKNDYGKPDENDIFIRAIKNPDSTQEEIMNSVKMFSENFILGNLTSSMREFGVSEITKRLQEINNLYEGGEISKARRDNARYSLFHPISIINTIDSITENDVVINETIEKFRKEPEKTVEEYKENFFRATYQKIKENPNLFNIIIDTNTELFSNTKELYVLTKSGGGFLNKIIPVQEFIKLFSNVRVELERCKHYMYYKTLKQKSRLKKHVGALTMRKIVKLYNNRERYFSGLQVYDFTGPSKRMSMRKIIIVPDFTSKEEKNKYKEQGLTILLMRTLTRNLRNIEIKLKEKIIRDIDRSFEERMRMSEEIDAEDAKSLKANFIREFRLLKNKGLKPLNYYIERDYARENHNKYIRNYAREKNRILIEKVKEKFMSKKKK